MPRNDQSDSKSVRSGDDPRRPLKALQQEAELEHGSSEARDTGGAEHQSREDREGTPRERRPVEAAARPTKEASERQHESQEAADPPARTRR